MTYSEADQTNNYRQKEVDAANLTTLEVHTRQRINSSISVAPILKIFKKFPIEERFVRRVQDSWILAPLAERMYNSY